ncbi:MAG TPA: glycine cleavage system protein H [Methylomirabilota bacterium]|nr:glycine cleavage system protein H [Methylomirabilota bacterium]
MNTEPVKTLHYRKSRFVTHLPIDYRYTPSHYWAAPSDGGVWRVGFTKFATRMLGDMVDHGVDAAPGTKVSTGDVLGWIEGFKALSDLYAVGEGELIGSNPALKERVELVSKRPYDDGWIYQFKGELDERAMDVHAYAQLLDVTIQRILDKEQAENEE